MPTGTYINKNYEQDLINSLTEGNLFRSFSTTFMLNHLPNYVDSSLCNECNEYYYERARNICCSFYKVKFELTVVFMSTCGQFYCSICASYLVQKERTEPLEGTECMQTIETGELPVIPTRLCYKVLEAYRFK